MTFLRNLWNDEQGQDLIEYTLLMAFVALASAALFIGAGGSVKGIWSVTTTPMEPDIYPMYSLSTGSWSPIPRIHW